MTQARLPLAGLGLAPQMPPSVRRSGVTFGFFPVSRRGPAFFREVR
jgi:hypothetical protein